ncbi:Gfo/Idh/MocA family protein [Paenibacillus sp. OV219]|uniref:Gfo/Idh/MocA family protein n=1 Tax=Paenibacillus sp. OV219 TaxID=1884377 RepID=UPI0008D48E1C|nr:Gfo/Idh/MocA family oxidoreductase [Paenibacillus sp. OV219]SEN74816.1 Predicted dehydrogenase [Paenibacillus sp. OV219]
MMVVWRIGLVGTGFWSEKHLQAWSRIPNVQITALCNRSRDKMIEKARRYGVPAEQLYGSLEEMLEKADIDIVDIVTGPETHPAFVEMAAKAGKHVLCQKPFAESYEEAERMVKAASDAGVRLMVTENWRWLSIFQKMKQVLDEGELGRVLAARYMHSDYFTMRMSQDMKLPQPFFRKMPRLLFYEMGVHWFDTWRFLLGEPKRLYAEFQYSSPHVIGEDSGLVTLGHDGFYGMLDMSWATRRELHGALEPDIVLAHHIEQFVIDGDKATLKLYGDGSIAIIDNNGGKRVLTGPTELDHDESHYRLSSHFVHCLESGEPFQTSGEDNLRTLRLTFSTYESARTHQAISFEY